MKMSKILICLVAMVFVVFSLTTVAFASDDGINDESICLDDEYIPDEDLEVYLPDDEDSDIYLPDDGCYCGDKPCVTVAPEPETKPVTTTVKPESKPTTKNPTVTTAKTEEKAVTTSIPIETKPPVTTISPAEKKTDESLEEDSSEDSFSDMFSGILSMFGDIDFDNMDFDLNGFSGEDFSFGIPLTPDGNMSLVDDIYQDESYDEGEQRVIQSKQFITVQTKSGNSFYIIIDRSKDGENVYFLNLVDESDLLSLMEEAPEAPAEPEKPAECICKDKDKCELGAVNAECEVCKMDLTKCLGKEKPKEEVKPDGAEKEAPKKEKKSVNPALLLLPLLALAGGGVYWFFKIRKPKLKNVRNPDDYDFGDDSEGDYSEEEVIDDETEDETEGEM